MEAHSSAKEEGSAKAAKPVKDVKGLMRPSLKRDAHRFLSDVIVELGFTDRATVDFALDEERRKGKRMGRFLVEQGSLTEQQLGMAIAERYALDYLDLSEFEIDTGAANLVTQEAAKRFETVPVGFVNADTLLIAIADPTDGFALNDVAVMTRLEVQPAVAARSDILALIERLPHSTRSAVVVDLPRSADRPAKASGEVQPALGVAPAPEEPATSDAGSRTARAIEELKTALLAEADQHGGDVRERLSAAEAEAANLREDLERAKVEAVRERNDWVVSHQRLEEDLRIARRELDSARSRHG